MGRAASWGPACLLRCSHKQKDIDVHATSFVTSTLDLSAEEHTSVASRTVGATNRMFEDISLSIVSQRSMCDLLIGKMAAFLPHAFIDCEHAAQSLNGDVLCIFMSASSRATGGSRRYAGYSSNGLPLYR